MIHMNSTSKLSFKQQNRRNSDKKENLDKNLPLSSYPLLSKLSAYMDKPVS